MNRIEIKSKQIQLGSLCLGLIALWILGKKVGDSGIAYLVAALEVYALVWALTAKSLPDALGRILRSRMMKGQYKNALKMRRCVFFFQVILSMICCIMLGVGTSFAAERVFGIPHSKSLIILMIPAVFLRTVNSVLLGIYQGEGNELPTAVSSVLRQILILVFGLLFTNILTDYGVKVSNLSGQEAFISMYGGMGICLAILLSEVLILLFLIILYKSITKERRKKDGDGMRAVDSFAGQIYALYIHMGIPVLCGILELFPLWIGLFLYHQSYSGSASIEQYGVYLGKYLVLCGIPCCLIAILLFPAAARTVERIRNEEYRYGRSVFQCIFKSIMAQGLYGAVYMTVMAPQLAGTFSQTAVDSLNAMLRGGSVLVLFGVGGFFGLCMLGLWGKKTFQIVCLAAADLVFLITIAVCLKTTEAGIMSLVYAGVLGAAVLTVGTWYLLLRCIRCTPDMLRMFAIPIGGACLSGLLCFLLGRVLTPHLGNHVTLLVTFVLSVLLYGGVLSVFRMFGERELDVIPGGVILRAVGKILRIY